MRTCILCISMIVLAACRAGSTAAPQPAKGEIASRSGVRPDGWNGLRFGMDLARAQAEAGVPIDAPAEGCVQLAIGSDTPAGVVWMFADGVLARLDVRSDALATEAGAKVGTTAAELRGLYPDAVEGPHKYDPEGSTWVVGPSAEPHYVFELDGKGEVTQWRAGMPPQVDWVEGCG